MNTQIILKAADLVIKAGIFTALAIGVHSFKSALPQKAKPSTQSKVNDTDDHSPSEEDF